MAASPIAITFQGKLGVRDLAHVYWYQMALRYPRRRRWLVGLLGKVGAVICLYLIIEFGPNVFLAWGFLGCTAYAVHSFLVTLDIWGSAVDHYRQHADDFVETCIGLTVDGVTMQNGHRQCVIDWDEIGFVAKTPKGLLFFRNDNTWLFWLPTRVFREDVTRADVLSLLDALGVATRKVS